MDVLNETKDEDLAIFRAHVKRTLDDHADKMNENIVSGMAGFTSAFWSDRNISSDEFSLFYKHRPEHRFVDMKKRVVGDRIIQKKAHQIHNRIIMGHFNGIQLDLTYGLTEQVRENLKKQFDGKVL